MNPLSIHTKGCYFLMLSNKAFYQICTYITGKEWSSLENKIKGQDLSLNTGNICLSTQIILDIMVDGMALHKLDPCPISVTFECAILGLCRYN